MTDATAPVDVPSNMRQLVIWVLCGFLMSAGMSIGGMAHVSSLYFFDPFRTGHFHVFDWSMLVLFCAALIPTAIYWQLLRRPSPPWFASRWQVPTDTKIDSKLVVGSAVFGAGWALGGFCPGPSVAGLLTGHPHFIAFSYGMYFQNILRSFFDRRDGKEGNWALSIALGAVPVTLAFVGPHLFPITDAPRPTDWPLPLSVIGGLGIGVATILLFQFNGRVLGLSGIWRDVLDLRLTTSARLPQVLFFLAYMAGAAAAYAAVPGAFALPPYGERSLVWVLLGGFLVGQGTEWANGCTSGHGIAGVSRLSRRSLVAVPTFMGAVFVCVPLFNLLLGS